MLITVYSIYMCTSSNAYNLQMLEVYTYNLHSCFLRFTEATMPTITLSLWMKISAQQVFASGLWAPCCFSASWSFCSFSSGTIRPREKWGDIQALLPFFQILGRVTWNQVWTWLAKGRLELFASPCAPKHFTAQQKGLKKKARRLDFFQRKAVKRLKPRS